MDDHPTQLSVYGYILLMGIIGALLVGVTIFLAKLIAPHKPNSIKESTYECGEETIGTAWVQFNPRFYVIALVFLLFDVELIFIFPWSVIFGNEALITADERWGWFTMIEMAIFLAILIVGLVYVWSRGDLNWIKPNHIKPTVGVNIPREAYEHLNNAVYAVRDYRESKAIVDEKYNDTAETNVVKPSIGFKPKFKKS
ncbi:NADH-quinone oxidoreductase subunit A [Sphingobacterium faecale]|uniref:NADH-quinone oxidoreductase subunit A n=1 Tax=Sphingobacterium faecale TaxID=2803775 RepID=A0ABS1QZM8_9SPHI|nr:NADH-quinone oxidoreductase subunit A [Sphingobacterium faecale]MBL1407893.1 NADH-quinone oxidoreductase subunit A [Sphingobacterium faecale]